VILGFTPSSAGEVRAAARLPVFHAARIQDVATARHAVATGKLDMVGIFPNYATAHAAWKAQAQKTVDNAHVRYFIVHMHRLLDPATDTTRKS